MRLTSWLQEAMATAGAAWLRGQRWFGGKARDIRAVDVEDVVWLPASSPAALCVLAVHYAGGSPDESASVDRYATLVGLVSPGAGDVTPIATLSSGGLQVVDATAEPNAMRALLGGLATKTALTGVRGSRVDHDDATGAAAALVGASDGFAATKPLGAEQSNTSVRIGRTHIFKLFRRLQEGTHPQVEMGRFLARAGFRDTPQLEGTLHYRPAEASPCALAVLEQWVENVGDGWTFVLDALERAVRQHEGVTPLVEPIADLGTLTGELHVALASDTADPAFAPEPVTAEDCERWRTQVHAQARRALALVTRERDRWASSASELAAEALRLSHEIPVRLRALDAGSSQGARKIRLHGDFHLGQTLKTREGFAIVDFEGEPVKPLLDRRQKHCALKDVAGMLRSIDYAVATVRTRLEPAVAMPDAGELRRAYLEGYRTSVAARGGAFLPTSLSTWSEWLAVFELEKALYEVEYEVNNRPAWVGIPLQGVVSLLLGTAAA